MENRPNQSLILLALLPLALLFFGGDEAEVVKGDPYERSVMLANAPLDAYLTRAAQDAERRELGKSDYVHGALLESVGRVPEAMIYWERGLKLLKPGEPFYDKLRKKLARN